MLLREAGKGQDVALGRDQHAGCVREALGHPLHVVEDSESKLVAGLPPAPVEEFKLQRAEEALGHGVFIGVADRPHRAEQPGSPAARRPAADVRRPTRCIGRFATPSAWWRTTSSPQSDPEGIPTAAMAEAFNSLYKWELIYPQGPWRGLDDVEFATLEYIDWFNHRRLHGEITRRQQLRHTSRVRGHLLPSNTSRLRGGHPIARAVTKPGVVHYSNHGRRHGYGDDAALRRSIPGGSNHHAHQSIRNERFGDFYLSRFMRHNSEDRHTQDLQGRRIRSARRNLVCLRSHG
jgi:hypothetical protein